MSSAFGEPPDSGVRRPAYAPLASVSMARTPAPRVRAKTRRGGARRGGGDEGGREPRRRAFYSCGGELPPRRMPTGFPPRPAGSFAREPRDALLEERGHALAEVRGLDHLLLQARLERELLVEAGVHERVDLALRARVGAR